MSTLTDPALAQLLEHAGIDAAEGLQLIALGSQRLHLVDELTDLLREH